MRERSSRELAAAYWRAITRNRPLRLEAARMGVSASTIRRHAQLWPEHLERLLRSTTLRAWERDNLLAFVQSVRFVHTNLASLFPQERIKELCGVSQKEEDNGKG